MALPARKLDHPATVEDLNALPAHMKGEIIDGVLYAMTRPRAHHQSIASRICADVAYPFERGRGGPGGWWILPEPGIELPGSPEVAPDIAGWMRERLPALPRDRAITAVPDWVCEVLSPTTMGYHYLVKRPFYARVGVRWLWEVNLPARLLTIHKLEGAHWLEIGAWSEEDHAPLPPFESVPLEVRAWWLDESAEG